jgi:integrase
MEKLTQARLDRAIRQRDRIMGERQPYQRQLLRDHDVRGFYVAVHGESIAYWFNYRPHYQSGGRRPSSRFIRIGDGATHALAEAREVARDLRRRVQKGEDPKPDDLHARVIARQDREAAVAQARGRLTCNARLPAYQSALEGRGHTAKHLALELARVRRCLAPREGEPGLGALQPDEITHILVEQALAAIPVKSRLPHFGALDRFLRWCLKGTGKLPATQDFDRHERPKAGPSRRRVLKPEELAALWRATETLRADDCDVMQFLLAVPCRREEAIKATWADIDLSARTWDQPTSKNDEPHRFPLNRLAMEILQRRQATRRNVDSARPFSGVRFDRAITGMRAVVPDLADWRPHDFRRSFETLLAEAGHNETVLDLIINHKASRTRGGVKGIYQRSERWDERVAALDAWAELLSRTLGDNVTPLRRLG